MLLIHAILLPLLHDMRAAALPFDEFHDESGAR